MLCNEKGESENGPLKIYRLHYNIFKGLDRGRHLEVITDKKFLPWDHFNEINATQANFKPSFRHMDGEMLKKLFTVDVG